MAIAEAARTTPRTLRWQWTLSNGGTVVALIDVGASTETVSQNGRVLSQAARGAKPDGHVVVIDPDRGPDRSERPGIEAVVTFAPTAAVCILRVDGHEVAPSEWPVREKPNLPPPPRTYGSWLFVLIGVVALGVCGLVVRTTRGEPADPKIGKTHRAPNGRFIAHYPEDLEEKAAILPPGAGGVVLESGARSTVIVIGAIDARGEGATDPWVLQQRLHDEALANLPKGAARYEETARRDETCLEKPGAIVTGRLVNDGRATARVWSCTFASEDTGYIALYMVSDQGGRSEERRARTIVDSIELTRLSDLGAPATGADPFGVGGPTPAGSLPRLDLPR